MRQFIKHTMFRTDWLIQWIRYNDFCIFQCFFHLFFPTDPSVLSAKQTFCFFQRAEYFHRTAIFLFDPCCQRFHGHRFSDQSHFLLSACRFRLLYFFSRCRISVSLLLHDFFNFTLHPILQIWHLLFFFQCFRNPLCIRTNRRSNHIRSSEPFFQHFRRTKSDRRYHQIHLCFSCLQKCIQFISHCPSRQHLPSTGFQVLFQHLYMRYRSKVQWCHPKQIDGACLNPSCLFPGKSFCDLL